MIDSREGGRSILTAFTGARGHDPHAPCVSYLQIGAEFSSKSRWGGPRPNSGGARANSGGARPGAGRPRKPPVQPMSSSALRWYCVRTKHREELTADTEMRVAGFTVFTPTIWKPPEEMRRYTNGSIRRARPARVVPMFRRYVFVQFDISEPGWPGIKDLDGVDHIFSTPNGAGQGKPSPISDAAIEWIRALLSPNGCLYPPGHHDTPIEVGTSLKLLDGPLIDRAAICQMSDGKRVRMLMQMFNRDVPVTVAQSAVEAV
jgi:transcription antitermination factor NusG